MFDLEKLVDAIDSEVESKGYSSLCEMMEKERKTKIIIKETPKETFNDDVNGEAGTY